jgi:hypothetical protein
MKAASATKENGSPVRVGRLHADIRAPAADYAKEFAARGSLYLRDFLAPDVLETVRGICRAASFVTKDNVKLGSMEVEWPRRAGLAVSMALTQPALLRWLEAVTRCGPLKRADGRIAQGRSGQPHALDWHDDRIDPNRRLAITVNLTEEDYEGGLFELRDQASGRIVTSHRHDVMGAALIFEVSARYEHRILAVTAGGPRRVYTGWFYAPGGSPG